MERTLARLTDACSKGKSRANREIRVISLNLFLKIIRKEVEKNYFCQIVHQRNGYKICINDICLKNNLIRFLWENKQKHIGDNLEISPDTPGKLPDSADFVGEVAVLRV